MTSRPLSILMVHPHDLWYDPWTIRILELARGLKARGHSVTLCHLPRKEKPSSPPVRQPQPGDPDIHALQPRQVHIVPNFKRLYRLAQDCDLIHVQKCFVSTTLPALWVSRLLQKPLHYDWDDNETEISKIVERRWLSRFQLALFERHLPAFASTLTYSSEAIRLRAEKQGFPQDRMMHLPVGADTERFMPVENPDRAVLSDFGLSPDKPTVLYIGQMEGACHAHQLIEAAPLVLQQCPDAQFLLLGGGEQLEEMRSRAQASPASGAIRLPGYIAQDGIPAVIAASTVCVACFDDDEATRAKSPLKIAEYLASGKPVVASNVGEVPYMLDGCGVTVPPGDIPALAQGIVDYLKSGERRRIDGRKARQRAVGHFTWSRGVDTLIEIYQRTVESVI